MPILQRLQLAWPQPGVEPELKHWTLFEPAGLKDGFALGLREGLDHVIAGLAGLADQLHQGNAVKGVELDQLIIEGIFQH
ncbi:hypothetical protein D3C78_1410080 [compost metagenome]